jgi:hypothetical protein
VRRARPLAVVVTAGVLAGWLVLRDQPQPVAKLVGLPDAAPLPSAVDAGVVMLEAAAPAPMEPVTFQDGFCAGAGGEGLTVRFTLERLLAVELMRQADGGLATSSLGKLMWDAVRRRGAFDALERARTETSLAPGSLYAQVTMALAARGAAQFDEQLAALRRARALAPDDPAIGWAIAEATRESPDLDEAITGLGVYLAHDPSPAMSRLRARLEVQHELQRDDRRLTHDGVTLLWPPATLTDAQADALARDVDRALDDAAALTGTTRRARLTVVVYPGRSELLAVSCARSWTAALFDGTLRLVANASAEGVDRGQVLHETLHAQLSPVAPNAPKWFHEGVAQSFGRQRVPHAKWALMVRTRTWVPFSSLDGTFQAFEADSDADLAYAQAYAMVELMRAQGGDASVAAALQAFLSGADTSTALARACRRSEVTGGDLLEFLGTRLGEGH